MDVTHATLHARSNWTRTHLLSFKPCLSTVCFSIACFSIVEASFDAQAFVGPCSRQAFQLFVALGLCRRVRLSRTPTRSSHPAQHTPCVPESAVSFRPRMPSSTGPCDGRSDRRGPRWPICRYWWTGRARAGVQLTGNSREPGVPWVQPSRHTRNRLSGSTLLRESDHAVLPPSACVHARGKCPHSKCSRKGRDHSA